MTPSSAPKSNALEKTPDAWRAIGWGGLIGGTFDILFAFIYYGLRGATVMGVLHSVASGLLGRTAANDGGVATAALGLFLHYLIAFSWAALYYLASRKLPVLIRQAIPCGLVYGAVIYFAMNLVVLSLSALHSHPVFLSLLWPVPPLLGHMAGIGLPMALAVRRYSR
jgi:hypothetical protein